MRQTVNVGTRQNDRNTDCNTDNWVQRHVQNLTLAQIACSLGFNSM